jgi:hypothetical protein
VCADEVEVAPRCALALIPELFEDAGLQLTGRLVLDIGREGVLQQFGRPSVFARIVGLSEPSSFTASTRSGRRRSRWYSPGTTSRRLRRSPDRSALCSGWNGMS